MTIVEFCLARLDEQAIRATMRTVHEDGCEYFPVAGSEYTYPCNCRFPEWMLADAGAKRAIVRKFAAAPDWTGGQDVRLLAAIDKEHPDYDPGWAPGG